MEKLNWKSLYGDKEITYGETVEIYESNTKPIYRNGDYIGFVEEEWREVVLSGLIYKVSTFGRIISPKGNIINGSKKTKTKTTYRRISVGRIGNKRIRYYIHRVIMLAFVGESDLQVNHIDFNGENNFILNLEYISNRSNVIHYRKSQEHSSRYTGVTFDKKARKWKSQLYIKGHNKYLGLFSSEEDAHKAYQNKLKSIGENNTFIPASANFEKHQSYNSIGFCVGCILFWLLSLGKLNENDLV